MLKYLVISLLLVVAFLLPAVSVAADDGPEVTVSDYDRDTFYRTIMTMSGPAAGGAAMGHALDVWNHYCWFMGWQGGDTFDEALQNWKSRQVETEKAPVFEGFELEG